MKKLCINCSSTEVVFYLKVIDKTNKERVYYRCNDCELIFMYPVPSYEEIKSFYSNDYYGQPSDEKFSNNLIVNFISYFSERRVIRFSKYLNDNAIVLDIGCGNGRFLKKLKKHLPDSKLYGYEIDGRAAERARHRLKDKATIITNKEFSEVFTTASLDAISIIHVFEHLSDPKKMLDNFSILLKPGGKLLIVVPNIKSYQFKIFKKYWFHLDPPYHLNFFTPQSLIKELEKRNLKLIYKKTIDIEQNPFALMQSFLNVFLKPRDFLYESLKGNKTNVSKLKINLTKLASVFLLLIFLPLDLLISCFNYQSGTVEFLFEKTKEL